jgi:hypothetical protein
LLPLADVYKFETHVMQIFVYVMLAFIGLVASAAVCDRRALLGLRCARSVSRLCAGQAMPIRVSPETATRGPGTEARATWEVGRGWWVVGEEQATGRRGGRPQRARPLSRGPPAVVSGER